MASSQPPSLIHYRTLSSPSGITRAWSSRPHPSPRSPLLATASSDKSVQVWDLRDFKLVSTINGGHKRSIRCVGWKDWGQTVSQPQEDLDVPAEGRLEDADVDAVKEKAVTLATGSFDSNVGIWVYNPTSSTGQGGGGLSALDELDMTNPPDEDANEEEWHFTTLLTGPDSEIKDLQFSPPHYGANLLATCSRDKSVWVWEEVEDDNEWETIAVLGDHTGDVKCVAWCSGAYTQIDAGDGKTENTLVGAREILATGSYDDTVRLWRDVEEEGDWMCVAVIDGHTGTVWDLCWENFLNTPLLVSGSEVREWEPRILSCSDDLTIRLWRRELSESEKEKKKAQLTNSLGGQRPERLPSIIRPPSTMEKWVEDCQLPAVHVRSIYSVDWSKRTGLVVSCGGDGTVAVYREVLQTQLEGQDVHMNGTDQEPPVREDTVRQPTTWTVVASIETAHNEYEVNHVCWSPRRDKHKRWKDEEVIVSTGDDGDVRIWTLPEELIDPAWRT